MWRCLVVGVQGEGSKGGGVGGVKSRSRAGEEIKGRLDLGEKSSWDNGKGEKRRGWERE